MGKILSLILILVVYFLFGRKGVYITLGALIVFHVIYRIKFGFWMDDGG